MGKDRRGDIQSPPLPALLEVIMYILQPVWEKDNVAYFQTPHGKWLRIGRCLRCGKCCDASTLPQRLVIYQKHGVAALIRGEPCPHFEYRNNKGFCKIYEGRPEICRLFPVMPIDVEALPSCGYKFVILN